MRLPEMPPARVPDDVDTDEFRLGHILDAAKTAAEFVRGRARGANLSRQLMEEGSRRA